MNLKFVSVALLALALASTMVLTGCKPKDEATDVDVTTEETPAVMEEEVVTPVEEGTEVDVTTEDGDTVVDEHAATEEHTEEAHH